MRTVQIAGRLRLAVITGFLAGFIALGSSAEAGAIATTGVHSDVSSLADSSGDDGTVAYEPGLGGTRGPW